MGTSDRLASAMASGNLAWDTERVRDVDYIAALGMAGIHHKTASAIYRMLHSGDRASCNAAAVEIVKLIRRMACRQGWSLKPHKFAQLAHETLAFALAPRCPACLGRKYEPMPGSPCLSDRPCQHCRGTGLRRTDGVPYLKDVLAEIERAESIITHRVGRYMSHFDIYEGVGTCR